MRKRSHRRRMRKALCGLVALGFVIMLAGPAFAEHPGDKLYRGVMNSATGWIELPKMIEEEGAAHDPFYGLVVGSVKGTGATAWRTTLGALETGLFLFPPFESPIDPALLL